MKTFMAATENGVVLHNNAIAVHNAQPNWQRWSQKDIHQQRIAFRCVCKSPKR